MSLYKQEIYRTEKAADGKSVRVRTGKFYPEYRYEFVIDGRRFRGNTGKTNERDAEKEETRLVEETTKKIREHKSVGGAFRSAKTLGQAIDRWWLDHGQHLSSRSGAQTKKYLDNILDWQVDGQHPLGKNVPLAEVTDEKISALISWRRSHSRWGREENGKLTNSQIRLSTIEPLRRLFIMAREDWKLHLPNCPNWRKLAKHLRVNNTRVRVLRKSEHEALAQSMRPDFEEVRLFALASGFRKKECLLQWSEVDLDGKVIIVHGKGGDEIRRPITTKMAEILSRQRGKNVQWVFTYRAERGNGGREIGNSYPITYEGLKTEWRRARAAAAENCPSLIDPTRRQTVRWHDLRHTYATNLARKCKGNPAMIQRGMGHKRFESTMRYVHAVMDDVLVAMEAASADSIHEQNTVSE